ncbi:hypothetical protein [Paenibacillus planticolens]|uniref:Lipoprotein n=1 Tax=Paenibacillus planticolens TaxID=2654976 RepID=A0ABX1ZGA8_9BACL|nr:hypothetical protein [Paenibacillus planticolens]NOU98417.1 hypothetical protein [Paenibacillus planticolens]
MRFVIIVALLAAMLGLTGCGETKQANSTVSDSGIYSNDFTTFKKNYGSKTEAQQDELWKTIKGKEIQWSGEVYDAFADASDKSTGIIVVRIGADFVKFSLPITEDIASLNKGTKITLKGVLAEPGGSLKSWGVTNASVVK